MPISLPPTPQCFALIANVVDGILVLPKDILPLSSTALLSVIVSILLRPCSVKEISAKVWDVDSKAKVRSESVGCHDIGNNKS